ncbi:MAG: DUF2786 domain-containing protein [Hyphomicrobiaceae bacterium]|nr:DUF2786 domain-containing protein [Hyphomicrobiaceae bacterium]
MAISEALKRKIAALRAKTREAGCTEEEAMSAAAMAAQLMSRYGISDADLVMSRASSPKVPKRDGWRVKLCATIGYCTATATLFDFDTAEVVFFGREPGPEIAAYLRDVTFRAIDSASREFKRGAFYAARRNTRTRRKALEDFAAGMAMRLSGRLWELFKPTWTQREYENAMIYRDQAVPDSRRRVSRDLRDKPRYVEALSAGVAAGNKVGLHHATTGAPAPVALKVPS